MGGGGGCSLIPGDIALLREIRGVGWTAYKYYLDYRTENVDTELTPGVRLGYLDLLE